MSYTPDQGTEYFRGVHCSKLRKDFLSFIAGEVPLTLEEMSYFVGGICGVCDRLCNTEEQLINLEYIPATGRETFIPIET